MYLGPRPQQHDERAERARQKAMTAPRHDDARTQKGAKCFTLRQNISIQ
jgi:hypothetical protein